MNFLPLYSVLPYHSSPLRPHPSAAASARRYHVIAVEGPLTAAPRTAPAPAVAAVPVRVPGAHTAAVHGVVEAHGAVDYGLAALGPRAGRRVGRGRPGVRGRACRGGAEFVVDVEDATVGLGGVSDESENGPGLTFVIKCAEHEDGE